jgi:acetyltransferase-like isoleucine patch superfamily enzyme
MCSGGFVMDEIKLQRSIVEEKGNILMKYMDRVLGTRNPLYLLKYEIFNLSFNNTPGALGIFFRYIFYPFLLGSCGKGVQFGRGVSLRGGKKISLGKGTFLDDFSVLDSKSEYNPGIVVGEKCLVSRNTKLSTGYTGFVKIGNQTIIGENCIIHGPGGIEIGDNVLISDAVLINAGLHVYSDKNKTVLSQGITTKGIKIGNDVWLGTGVLVKDGVTIGNGCVVGAGSVVSESLPDYSVALGMPAKVVGSRG